MDSNSVSIGSWITLGHFSIAEIMAEAGFDWLCIDLEHSVIDYLEVEKIISAIEHKNCIPYVRVGANDPLIIKRVLDAGAMGVIIPMVKTPEEAEQAVQFVKYPPQGSRGVGLARAQGYGFNFDEYSARANQEIKIIIQIEHVEAVEKLDSILSVEGIDGTIVGPYDLSGSMGKPGKYDDNDVKLVLDEYERISREKGVPMGFHVIKPDHRLVMDKINSGYSLIAFSLDTLFLGTSCRTQIGKLREEMR
jgi:2-keto-3-deoxy-L-rhamnonate aldolase RhmA